MLRVDIFPSTCHDKQRRIKHFLFVLFILISDFPLINLGNTEFVIRRWKLFFVYINNNSIYTFTFSPFFYESKRVTHIHTHTYTRVRIDTYSLFLDKPTNGFWNHFYERSSFTLAPKLWDDFLFRKGKVTVMKSDTTRNVKIEHILE